MKKFFDEIVVENVTDIVTFNSSKGRVKTIENRNCYGLSFCTEGQITYKHKNKCFVSNPSNAILLPRGATYTLYGDKQGVFPVINFVCSQNITDEFILFPVENIEAYMSDYEQMKALCLFEGNRTKIISLFYSVLHRLNLTLNNSSKTLMPALKYLQENYNRADLSNKVLSKLCNLSEAHFRKLFLAEYNTTPHQYLIEIRISKAQQLLTDHIMKINTVADKCGFSNPYHFCRAFKEKTGMTPTQYRKQNKIYKI